MNSELERDMEYEEEKLTAFVRDEEAGYDSDREPIARSRSSSSGSGTSPEKAKDNPIVIFYVEGETRFTRTAIETDVLQSPDTRSIDSLIRRGVLASNLSLLLRCKHLSKASKNYIYKHKRVWPQLELYVKVEPLKLESPVQSKNGIH